MRRETKRIIIQVVLFIATFITTTMAGAEWVYGRSIFSKDYSLDDFYLGFSFSIPLILILTVHEFGHYFMAMYHRIKTSLPYYIPIPPIPFLFSFGTFGAVIRLRERPHTTRQTFDIGIAGPIAGFVIAVILLVYGFKTLPPADYIYQFHPEYEQYGTKYPDYAYNYDSLKPGEEVMDLQIGKSLIFVLAENLVDDPTRIPNMRELMHYPLLFAVYFALFVTSLNLLPIGQLDGGHVLYGLFGFKKHKVIASVFFVAFMFYGALGNPYVHLHMDSWDLLLATIVGTVIVYFAFGALGLSRSDTLVLTMLFVALQFLCMVFIPDVKGYFGWFFLGLILARMVGIQHPPSEIEQPLDSKRIMLGWFAVLIFILCISPVPFDIQIFSGK
jgi:membrane-associated protease RseP (regulator of RpoE activity)